MNGRRPNGLDPITAQRIAAMQAGARDPREVFMTRCGLSAIQLEQFAPRVEQCLCGKCQGPVISFSARYHWFDGGIALLAPGEARPVEAGPAEPATTEETP